MDRAQTGCDGVDFRRLMSLAGHARCQSSFTLRPYDPADETAAIDLWQRTWQQAYPVIDFAARREWWCRRWRVR